MNGAAAMKVASTLVVALIAIFALSVYGFRHGYFTIGDATFPLPGGYLLVSEGQDENFIMLENGQLAGMPYIPCNVASYTVGEKFILAKQVARHACFFYDTSKTAFTNGETYYWIVDAENHSLHGPYDWDKFLMERAILAVPQDLELER